MSAAAQTQEISFRKASLWSLAAAAVGAGLCVLGFFLYPTQWFGSYLAAFHYWLGLSLGALAIWLLHNLTGGAWGVVIRRILEAATRTLPVLVVVFVPLLFGLGKIYPWARPDAAKDHHLAFKVENYLYFEFFLVRACVYFAVWLGIIFLLSYWSSLQDRVSDPKLARRVQSFSGPALALHGLAVTFASIDWVMSLEPKWYSSIFGVLMATGEMLPALGLAIALACWLAPRKPIADVVDPDIWNDLGNMLLAFVMLWSYMAFSQFLLIWSGNLPEEITWYQVRAQAGWRWVAVALAVFYFALPFCLLLSRDIKRYPRRLGWVGLALGCVSILQEIWLIGPTFRPTVFSRYMWLDVAAFLAVGGLWLAEFFRQLQSRPLVPVHNPKPEEVLSHA